MAIPTFQEDRDRLRVLNKSHPLTPEQWTEKRAVQVRLREHGFYGKPKRGPEREDSEAEAIIERMLSRY